MIESIQGSYSQYWSLKQNSVEENSEQIEEKPVNSQEETAPVEPVDDEGGLRGENGVLRLLQEGHFKGVAAVRLRMNFSEELSQLNAERQEEETSQLLESVTSDVDELVRSSPELATAEPEEVSGALDSFSVSLESVSESTADDLKTAFSDLRESLRLLLSDSAKTDSPESAPTDATEPGSESEPAEGTVVPDTTSTGLLEQLDAILRESLSRLEQVAVSDSLPPLEPPSGNGKAYQKFLDEYLGIEPQIDSSPVSGTVSTVDEVQSNPVDIDA